MARPNAACQVPGCKGSIEPGTREGKVVAWCRVCERRILQLQSLHARLSEAPVKAPPAAASKGTDISDAELLKLITERCVSQNIAAKLSRRSLNLVMQAAKDGEVPMVRVGRICVFGRASVTAWGKAWKRKPFVSQAAREIIAILPRSAAEAITQEELSKRTKRGVATMCAWLNKHRLHPSLKRMAALNERGNAVLKFYWEEANHG